MHSDTYYKDMTHFYTRMEATKAAVATSRETAHHVRDATYHGEFAWHNLDGLWECHEQRHDSANSTHPIVVGYLITRHSASPLEWIASCAHCGREFVLDDDHHIQGVWRLDANDRPVGNFCCSRECAEDLDVDLGITCATCGVEKAVRRDAHGNPSCGLLCESRALRTRVIELLGLSLDASEQELRDTIPAPPPWCEQDPGLRSADTEAAARPCISAA
jgi:hypothetical protein